MGDVYIIEKYEKNDKKCFSNPHCMKEINCQKRFLRTEKVWPGLLAARWGKLFLFERRGLLRGDTKTSLPSPDRFLETFAFNWDIIIFP